MTSSSSRGRGEVPKAAPPPRHPVAYFHTRQSARQAVLGPLQLIKTSIPVWRVKGLTLLRNDAGRMSSLDEKHAPHAVQKKEDVPGTARRDMTRRGVERVHGLAASCLFGGWRGVVG